MLRSSYVLVRVRDLGKQRDRDVTVYDISVSRLSGRKVSGAR